MLFNGFQIESGLTVSGNCGINPAINSHIHRGKYK